MFAKARKYALSAASWLGQLCDKFTNGLDRHRLMWLLLWGASMLSIIDIPRGIAFHMPAFVQIAYVITVGAFKGTLLFVCYLLCLRHRWSRYVAYIAVILFTIMAVINYWSLHFFGFGITRRMISIVMQTNHDEIFEFASYSGSLLTDILLSWQFWLAVAVCVALAYIVKIVSRKILNGVVSAFSAVGLVMVIAFFSAFQFGRTAHSILLRLAKYGVETYDDLREFEAMEQDLAPLPDAETVSSTHSAANVIVVIGESASRLHWSAYGYPLATTPIIDAMADSLYIMPDVIGSSVSTSLNLENILTFRNDDTPEGNTLRYPRLIDLFNTAGYKTFWLSNQEKTGLMSNLSSLLVSRADEIQYIGARSSEDNLIARYDEALLPYMRDALNDSADYKMIFLHLLGSHVKYVNRYPDSAAYFTVDDIKAARNDMRFSNSEATTIAEYDNSIRYTDCLLGEMVKAVSTLTEPTVFIYFSDHGVNVYDSDGIHGRGTRYVIVPAFIYLNTAYRSENPAIAAAVENTYRLPVTTACLAYPLMTLTGTTYSWYDATRDFLSPHYQLRPRYVDYLPWK